MGLHLLTVCYLFGSVTFIVGLKMLASPASARKGNIIAAVGMAIAILATIFLYRNSETGQHLHNYAWIFGGLLIGGIVGTLSAKKSKNDFHARNGKPVQWHGWGMCGINIAG